MQRALKPEWGFYGEGGSVSLKRDAKPEPEKPKRRTRAAKPKADAE